MKENELGKVLIIDDEVTYQTQLSMILKGRGYEVRTAGDGRDGISVGTSFLPDVLVADWSLRNTLSGLEVAEALRAVNPSLQTIVITGYSSQDLPEDAQTQVFCVLEKPFGVEEFVAAVRNAMDRSHKSS
jgi:two-component system, OmpR family, response regulator